MRCAGTAIRVDLLVSACADVPFGRLTASIGGRFEYGLVQRQDRRILDTLPAGRLELDDYAYDTVDVGSRLWFEKRERLRRAIPRSTEARSHDPRSGHED